MPNKKKKHPFQKRLKAYLITFNASYCQSSWKMRTREFLLWFQSLSRVHTFLWFLCVLCHHQSVLQTSHCALTFYFSGSLSLLIPETNVVWLIQVFNPFLLLLYQFPPSPPSLTCWSRFSLQVIHHTHSLVNRFICFITPLLSCNNCQYPNLD